MVPRALCLTNLVVSYMPPVLSPTCETCLHGGFEVQTTQTVHFRLATTRLLHVAACPVSANPLTPLSRLTRPMASSSVHVFLLFSAPHESPVTLPGLLRSLSPSLLVFVLHHPRSITMNLSPGLHRIRRPPRRILSLHITTKRHQIHITLSITDHLGLTTIGFQMTTSSHLPLAWLAPTQWGSRGSVIGSRGRKSSKKRRDEGGRQWQLWRLRSK